MILSFVYPSSSQYTGGVVALYEFANALVRQGDEVHFIHGPASPHRIDRLDELDWFRFEPGLQHHLTDSLDDPGLPAADVVFAPAAPARLGLPAVFIQGHGMMDPAWERDAFRARCPKVCIAKWLVDVGIDYGVPPEQLLHVPHGMDHDLFRTVTPLHERPIDVAILYNKHPAKGWDVAVDALERVRRRRPDLRVQVFGILPPEHPIPDWLPFRRGLDRQRLVTDVYNQARVFLQPSWFEGFGFTAVEAMACGCALVTTDNGGSQDYAVDGGTALVAPPGDAGALAAHVESLLADDSRRVTLASAGARHVRRFTWDHAGETLHHHMQRYVAEPQRYRGAPAPLVETGGTARSAPADPRATEPPGSRTSATEADLVFNIVWTGSVFEALRPFAVSLMAHSASMFRFVANGCPPEQVALLRQFQRRHSDRVVEVMDVSPDAMIAHGVALDRVRSERDDGPWFALVDPDIKANAPFVGAFIELLAEHDAVTSGKEVWTDDNLVPVDHPGVAGEHFFDRDGFVFGSPHLAIYDRAALDETTARWGVGLGSAGPELREDTRRRLADMGHTYVVYDTAKIVNALLQADGHRLVHRDLEQLVHIGGLAHYVSPPAYRTDEAGPREPDWTVYASMTVRHEVTRFTARTLQALAGGSALPPLPVGLERDVEAKLLRVREEVVDLVARYGSA